jgi:MinD superfamily P-loop ATPase
VQERSLAAIKHRLKMDRERYIDCCRCQKVCLMHLYANDPIVEKPDCINCGRCIEACPKGALNFLSLKG